MIRAAHKTRQSLLKKGFTEVQGRKHALYIFMYKGNEMSFQTFMSRNSQDIGDDLLSSMAEQVHLTKKDFIKLIDCPLSEEDYIKILMGKGLLKE